MCVIDRRGPAVPVFEAWAGVLRVRVVDVHVFVDDIFVVLCSRRKRHSEFVPVAWSWG